MSFEFGFDSFSSCLQQAFRLRVDDSQSLDLILVKAEQHDGQNEDHRAERFSLLFQGPPGIVLPQRMYRLNHERLGEFDLFIVPVEADDEGVRYEAVFS